jgi:pyruvate-ferredoxin/flavodoxin oxidoreductase
LKNVAPGRAEELAAQAQAQVRKHFALYQHLAAAASSKPEDKHPKVESGNGHVGNGGTASPPSVPRVPSAGTPPSTGLVPPHRTS